MMIKKLFTLAAVVLLLPILGAAQKPTPKPKTKPTPTPQQVQKAQLAALIRLEKAQRSALLAQQRARVAQQARLVKARQAQGRVNPPLRIVARPPAPTPRPTVSKPTPTPAPARSTKFTGVITAVDLDRLTVTLGLAGGERTFSFTPTVSLNFYSGEGNGLKSLTKGTTIDITSADGKNADVLVVHDLP
ncbi:hypothetical protein [Armatimonas rosea]|uniref:Uncharacterized protein n=1 Tax=Armatimonas rosea TaxID=685828 RepID=A0A7W9W974_ARMRO|nr:hypothetical protein [Armatimonas rosea]MBB6052337.1 hypothetical protein [Armatimonas rosea]